MIIGNPPYVKLETIKDVSASLEKLEYKTFDRRGDLYVLFVEKGFSLLKQGGAISYIMPNKWLQAGYGKKLREFFLTKQLNTLIDFGDIQIFEGATTYPVIFLAEQNQPQKSFTGALLKARKPFDFESNVSANLCEFETNKFSGDTWIISSEQNNSLLTRLSKQFVSLKEYIKGEANYGIKTGFSEAYFIDENKRQELIIANPKNEQIIKPLIQGRDIEPYATLSTSKYLLFIPWHFPLHEELNISGDSTEAAFRFENDYPEIFYHLLQYKDKLSVRNKSETGIRYEWYAMQRFGASYYKDFEKPKIMYQVFQTKPCFIFDESGLFCNNSMWFIPTENKALLGVLNSKMGWWLITKYCTQIQNGCQLIWKYFGEIPVPNVENNIELTQLVEKMIGAKANEQKMSSSFTKLLQSKFTLEKLTKKLQNWHELDFAEFLKELEKARKKAAKEQSVSYTKLSLAEEAEWMEFFTTQKEKAQNLQNQISQTDAEIDLMVYELYGLTEEEIKIVEGVV